uniref:Small ribosomal subunit protein uS3c n=4 Tax=Ephedra TaxID=3387 RepID=A0A8F4TJ48_9SPER|nr:ribosomal protein S3 [Ephedra milleri]YP_010453819.1 ribosomal protein S3 [Ephedra transitoria]QXG16652.1 ribosomal protein S3 [Ephedra distachya]QXG18391.1 ribosomal protein S3 [Ephedra sp.]QXG17655.1 ribosomal protein S3 [Ephedra milleri]QXG18659.1 ribosomal protein S3 [Ephedra transitoria]
MGHKVNPMGFRLGLTQNHNSVWFAQKREYTRTLREDIKIHKCIEFFFQRHQRKSYLGIGRIEIQRKIDLINIIIYIGFPIFFKNEKNEITRVKNDIKRTLYLRDQKLNINAKILAKPYQKTNILAEYIALQLEKRVAVKKILQKAVELAKKDEIEGIRIRIAGRLGGRERTRKTKIKLGRVTLQTLRAEMDYSCFTVRTIHGALGIQLWIFMKEQ